MTVEKLRKNYTRDRLLEAHCPPAPYPLFRTWLSDAITHCTVTEPNTMTLATVDSHLRPHTRIVLLKAHSEMQLTFFTNYLSSKGRELAGNPHAALQFFWPELERQVRIEGTVSKASAAENQAYFSSRPRGSQIGAIASPQSQVIASRNVLDERLTELAQEYPQNTTIPCPAHWGGYHLHACCWEFWQGRDNRLHDRIRYSLQPAPQTAAATGEAPASWSMERLAP